MELFDKVIDFAEEISFWVSSMTKQNLTDYIDFETADSPTTLVTKGGTMVSLIKLDGSRDLVGAEEFRNISAVLQNTMESYIGANGGHAVHFYFQYDKSLAKAELQKMFQSSRDASNSFGFSVDDILDDRIETLSKHCHVEECYVVLKTKIDAISKADLKRSREIQDAAAKKRGSTRTTLSQNLYKTIDGLRDRHRSFVSSFHSDLKDAGLISEVLDVHSACRAIRRSIDAEFTDDNWSPYLPGDKMPARIPHTQRDNDISHLMWPKLDTQLTPRSGMNLTHQYFKVGNRLYASLSMSLAPKNLVNLNFNVLFRRFLQSKIPFRVNYNLESGGLAAIQLKRQSAAILGALDSGNELIIEAYKGLEEQVKYNGEVDCKFAMAFLTWVDNGDMNQLGSNLSMMARAVEGWGSCEVSEFPGDPTEGFAATVLGHSASNIAVNSAAPLSEVVRLLPTTRPASPWETGPISFRTADGKLWAYQPGSSKQIAWIDLIFASMGSGKSVLMNSINLALCMDPRNKRLPRIAIIDIGPSSEGLILTLKDQLPEDRKHEALYQRIRMVPECAINPFDTNLGCRFPISSHRAFLTNFVMLLVTPLGQTKPYDGMGDMIGLAIDETYARLSDGKVPRRYSAGSDPQVDAEIAKLSIKVDRETTWWEIVDELSARKSTRIAALAQRFAVPVLADMIESVRSEVIRDMYTMEMDTKETPVDGFTRMINSAIREYPIISKPTKFDISEARVVSLDLDEVAKTGGEAADRQTAIMYMLARFVLARDFYLTSDNLKEMPEQYHAYHSVRIKENAEDIKRICMDELHRTSKATSVREQIVTDIREGRKWGVHVCLASQDLNDFDDIMVKLSTTIFIMGKFDGDSVREISERFSLSETATWNLANSTHTPRPGIGTSFIINFITNEASKRTSQLITSTIGSIEYWAFSTTAEDKIIRSLAYAKLGGRTARKLLSAHYPWGIKKEVERIAEARIDKGFDEGKNQGIIDGMFEELYNNYLKDTAKYS